MCNQEIGNALDVEQKARVLVRYLRERNEVERFKAFIEYFMTNNATLAKLINKQLNYQK